MENIEVITAEEISTDAEIIETIEIEDNRTQLTNIIKKIFAKDEVITGSNIEYCTDKLISKLEDIFNCKVEELDQSQIEIIEEIAKDYK